MRWSLYAQGATAFAALSTAQSSSNYCDELGRCFSSHSLKNGVTYGVAIPEVDEAPFKAIIQITAPVEIAWAGFAWAGRMTNSPLTITWPNGEDMVLSSRKASSHDLPTSNEDATLTLLDGSYVNKTHWVTTAVCQGCSSWAYGSNPGQIDPSGESKVGFAYSKYDVKNPSNPDTVFSIHDAADVFGLDFASAQSPHFGDWVGDVNPPNRTTPTS